MFMTRFFQNLRKFGYFLFFFSFLALFFCESDKEFIKRPMPDANFATVRIGDTVYSTTDFKFENDRQRLMYKFWKFEKADAKSVKLSYEEHLDYIKLKPDFKEEKTYEFDKNFIIRIQGMVLNIYALTSNSMVYYMTQGE